MSRTFFVTGTDTGVGKTLVTAALLLGARNEGLRAAALKPVAAGCELVDGQPMNADAVLLRSLSGVRLGYDEVNPVALDQAMAPHLAAARAGIGIRAADLAAHIAATRARHGIDPLLIEGAGGWLVPLNARETMADLVILLDCPVILVVGMRLGCLNHALLTAAAVAAAGLRIAGWVANSVAPAMDFLADNIQALESRLPAPCLGAVPWLGADCTAERASAAIDATSLWKS